MSHVTSMNYHNNSNNTSGFRFIINLFLNYLYLYDPIKCQAVPRTVVPILYIGIVYYFIKAGEVNDFFFHQVKLI